MIKRLCIFGVGLIGGSLALSLKKAGYCEKIIGCGLDESQLQQAVKLGAIDEYHLNPKDAVKDSDVVLLAVPIRAIDSILRNVVDVLEPHTIITDVGSAKGSVLKTIQNVYGGTLPSNFVAGHPIAGSEKSSIEAAKEDLYQNCKVILTPTKETSNKALNIVTNMWLKTGASVETLDFQQHDSVFSITSHLPHLLSYLLVNSLTKSQYGDSIYDHIGSGFQSASRLASSDPIMWRDICLGNKTAILETMEVYEKDFIALKNAIKNEDIESIQNTFENAKLVRDKNISDY